MPFWYLFAQILGISKFPLEKGLFQFLIIPIICNGAKNEKKLIIPEKSAELMHILTDYIDFIGPSIGQGSKKSNFEK